MIEVEIKSLLGDQETADKLKDLLITDFKVTFESSEEQKTHYFVSQNYSSSLSQLAQNLANYLDLKTIKELNLMSEFGSKLSIRSRFNGNDTLFIAKYSLNSQDTTSDNSVSRKELEVKVNLNQDELDKLIQDAGFTCQAKWSRYRENYTDGNLTYSLDRNAGYGWILEIEKIIDDESLAGEVTSNLKSVLKSLGLEEINPGRLDRMFNYYNQNWQDYYGTDKIFVIE
jgi:predicted adenylyl cyclase CyaB